MTLILDIPSREKPQRGGFPTRRRALARWLAWLGTVDRRERGRHLHDGVHTLNRLHLSPRRRLALLEDLRPAARTVLDYLASRTQSQSLPLPDKARQLHELDIDLLRELALGYAIVLEDSGTTGRRRRIALAAARVLALQNEWMLRAAQIYSQVANGFWRLSHGVYHRAEQARAGRRTVEDTTASSGRVSPLDLYKQLLLFTLSGTQGLRRGEAVRIQRALADWSRLAEFGPDRGEARAGTCFAVDLEQAIAPVARQNIALASVSRLRVLVVDRLVKHIERLQADNPPDDGTLATDDRIAAATLQRLLDSWRPSTRTRSERADRGEQVDAEIGLSIISTRLQAEQAPKSPQPRRRQRQDTPGAALTLQTIETAAASEPAPEEPAATDWSGVGRGQDRSAGYAAARRAEAGLDHEGTRPEHPLWLLQDVSATGFCLCWDCDGSSRAAVGELAALRLATEDDAQPQWSIGVIRRMRFLDDQRFEIGVEALTRNALPTRVRREPANPNRKRDRKQETSELALMLPGNQVQAIPASLLLPAHMFRCGEVLELELPDRMLRVHLASIQQNEGAFTQYALESAPSRGRHARARAGAKSDAWPDASS